MGGSSREYSYRHLPPRCSPKASSTARGGKVEVRPPGSPSRVMRGRPAMRLIDRIGALRCSVEGCSLVSVDGTSWDGCGDRQENRDRGRTSSPSGRRCSTTQEPLY